MFYIYLVKLLYISAKKFFFKYTVLKAEVERAGFVYK